MSKKLTHKEQVAAIAKINPNVEALEEIKGDKVKTLFRCKICGHEWLTSPNNLKKGKGCPECDKLKRIQRLQSRKLTHEEQVIAINKVNPDVIVLGKIVGDKTSVKCMCKICSHVWSPTPQKLKQGYGCPECAKVKIADKLRKTHEEQVSAINEINPDIEVLGEIVGDKIPVLCRCKVCDHKWSPTPNTLKAGKGCPECAEQGFRNSLKSCVYLLVDDLELPTCIKIGVSNDFNRRLDELTHRTPFPVHVLKVFTFEEGCATRQLEQFAHTVFSDRNCHFEGFDGCTEWFWYSHEIVDFLEDNC